MDPSLTFVVVARNEERNLPRLIRSIRAACAGWDAAPILVVNHGSRDGTREAARAAGAQVIASNAATIAGARNDGGHAVTTEWMAFIDADCELGADWLRVLAPQLDVPGLYGWPVRPPEPMTWVQAAWHTHWMTKVGGALERPEGAFRLITTANMVIHRSVWERLGGFDPELTSGEDQNLMLRAMKAGLPIRALPGLTVFHHGEPSTLREFFRQQLWHANRGSYRRIAHHTGLRQGANAPLFTLLYLLTLAGGLLGMVLAAIVHPAMLLLSIAWPALLLLPAARTAWRARAPGKTLALSVLYATYGLARSLDLLGLHPRKQSWRVE